MNRQRRDRGAAPAGTAGKGTGQAGAAETGRESARDQLGRPLAAPPSGDTPQPDPQATPKPAEPALAPRPHRMDIERPAHDEPGSVEALPTAEPASPGAAGFIEPAGGPDREATPPYLDES